MIVEQAYSYNTLNYVVCCTQVATTPNFELTKSVFNDPASSRQSIVIYSPFLIIPNISTRERTHEVGLEREGLVPDNDIW